jgi:hypothetical protein
MRAVRLALLVAAVAGGCHKRAPTYHQDVDPIFAAHCRECHHAGGVAPIPTLADYDSARMYAQPIKLAVQSRAMPPWAADDTGLCGRWQDARWLSSDEIATIARWQEAGAPEGPPSPSSPPRIPDAPFRADATLAIDPTFQPTLGTTDNRCFVADPRLERDRLLSAIRVRSMDTRGLAQVTLFALDGAAAENDAAALDAADATPGYACFGGARVDGARLVASWTWPTPVLRMPSGTGVRLAAGRKMIVQLHYDLSVAPGYKAANRIELEFDDAAREARVIAVAANGSLAPGRSYVAVEARHPFERAATIAAIAPIMHLRGDSMRLTVDGARGHSCLAAVEHWHFLDQQLFRLRDPVRVSAGDAVTISCAYNTYGRDRPVPFGEAALDEECVAWLFVTD